MLVQRDREPWTGMRTLIIDNYDSYTFNLLQLCDNQENVVVVRNDQFEWSEFKDKVLPHFHNVIISPGPGRPERASDFGICSRLIEAQLDKEQSKYHRPIFGICLGHQGIAHLLGGKITYAPRIMHGRMSQIHITEGSTLFRNCNSPFWAVRYHSLVVDPKSLPSCLQLNAYCEEDDADVQALKNAEYVADKVDEDSFESHHFLQHPPSNSVNKSDLVTVMGFQHTSLPLWGVQFHPESVSTEYGTQMIKNFMQETLNWYQKHGIDMALQSPLDDDIRSLSSLATHISRPQQPKTQLHLVTRAINFWVNEEHVFDQLVAEAHDQIKAISWLDSSRKASPYSNKSILSVDPAFTMTYSTLHKRVHHTYRESHDRFLHLKDDDDYFSYISRILSDLQLENTTSAHQSFCGGLVGYLGYEMKRESLDGYATPKEQQCDGQDDCQCSIEPDAGFQFVDRFWSFDLKARQIHVCCLLCTGGDNPWNVGFKTQQQAQNWLDYAERIVSQAASNAHRLAQAADYMEMTPISSTRSTPIPQVLNSHDDLFTTDAQHDRYLDAIERCIHEIHEGESYEICLTTRFHSYLGDAASSKSDIWRLYTRHLRKNNPAPFSALLHFPSCDMAILSSSPERFLSVSSSGTAEMKPIKGTMARAIGCVCPKDGCDEQCQERRMIEDERRKQTLWQDVKERAENLMIVDLIRNDLAQVCVPSTVRVPKLMNVETYEKVHHLVSTIRGSLHPHVTSVEAVRTCFPPGSMTGAPKLRSVQLLDQLEQHRPRGIYSGCLGYFSLDGSADFSVIIRTAVATNVSDKVELSVGAGGAVTFLSTPEQEWKETLLKTKSVAPSVKEFLSSY